MLVARMRPGAWSEGGFLGPDERLTEIAHGSWEGLSRHEAEKEFPEMYRTWQERPYDVQFPGYGFARHKGYCTREHFEVLERLGPSPLHRRSFAPVWEAAQRKLF